MLRERLFTALLFGLIFVAAAPASAADTNSRHEFSAGTTSAVTLRSGGNNDFALDGGYALALDGNLQIGGIIGLHTSPGSFSLLVGPTLNFGGGSLPNAFYLSGKVGVLDDLGSGAALEGRFGKRFLIIGNLAYSPFFRFVAKTGGGGSFFQAGIVNASLFF